MNARVSVSKAKDVDAPNAYRVVVTDSGEVLEDVTVNTNNQDEGLWIDGQQIEGTSQFEFVGSHSYRSYFQRKHSG